VTRAGLLSWTPGRKPKRTGLLARSRPSHIVTISDFSTVVTMGDREARARMFGILRVVYDGRVYRSIGGQAATESDALEWEGHLTILAGATHSIDTHLSFEAALGERWLLFRVAESTPSEPALERCSRPTASECPNCDEERRISRGSWCSRLGRCIPGRLSDQTRNVLVDAATLCAHARTGVPFEGTGRYRVPIGYRLRRNQMRLVGQLVRLARCLMALGLTEEASARTCCTCCHRLGTARTLSSAVRGHRERSGHCLVRLERDRSRESLGSQVGAHGARGDRDG
jgi:hypothetical protein